MISAQKARVLSTLAKISDPTEILDRDIQIAAKQGKNWVVYPRLKNSKLTSSEMLTRLKSLGYEILIPTGRDVMIRW